MELIRKMPQFLDKYDFVATRNTGFAKLKIIDNIVQTGDFSSQSNDFINELILEEIAAYKYAPNTSCDVERTFSMYKRVLQDC